MLWLYFLRFKAGLIDDEEVDLEEMKVEDVKAICSLSLLLSLPLISLQKNILGFLI